MKLEVFGKFDEDNYQSRLRFVANARGGFGREQSDRARMMLHKAKASLMNPKKKSRYNYELRLRKMKLISYLIDFLLRRKNELSENDKAGLYEEGVRYGFRKHQIEQQIEARRARLWFHYQI